MLRTLELSQGQKADLLRDGFTTMPGAVPRASTDAARHAINAWRGRGMEPGDMETFGNESFCPELTKPRIPSAAASG
jgi:hypothetical protein